MTIHNMAHQHREFQSWLDDTEKLRLYAQSAVSKHQDLDASLAKEKSKSKHWEREAKVARLVENAVGDAKARENKDLTRVQEALAAVEEGRLKAEAETTRLEVERTSLLLELRTTKDEVSSIISHASRDKEVIEEEYQKALEVIFAYGYECCVFKHNICGDHPEFLEGMSDSTDSLPLEFFVNLGCPPLQATTKAIVTEAPLREMPKEPMEVVVVED